jgi:hypothetical protein
MRTCLPAVLAAFALLLAQALPALGANTYEVKEIPYSAPPAPGPEETLIYVFRESSGFGAMRKIAIIDNDTVAAVLSPGNFSYFLVPSGQHEIVGYISPSPMMHFRVVPSPGKTVYLECKVGYASGLFLVPIEEGAAKQLIATFKYTEIGKKGEKAKMDYKAYYDNLFK